MIVSREGRVEIWRGIASCEIDTILNQYGTRSISHVVTMMRIVCVFFFFWKHVSFKISRLLTGLRRNHQTL